MVAESKPGNEPQNINLYMPGKPLLLVAIFGSLVALLGLLLLLTSNGFWLQLLASSFLLCLGALVAWYYLWLRHTPVFVVNAEGMRARYLAVHFRIKWEEIEAITDHGRQNGMPLRGIHIQKRRGFSQMQEVFLLESSLPIPVEQLLMHLQEQFREQLKDYGIRVQHTANTVSE